VEKNSTYISVFLNKLHDSLALLTLLQYFFWLIHYDVLQVCL